MPLKAVVLQATEACIGSSSFRNLRIQEGFKRIWFEYFQFKERKKKYSKKVHCTLQGRLVNEEVLEGYRFGYGHSFSLSFTVWMSAYVHMHCFVKKNDVVRGEGIPCTSLYTLCEHNWFAPDSFSVVYWNWGMPQSQTWHADPGTATKRKGGLC